MSLDRTAGLSHFAFMPVPNFTMIAFTNAIEVLRMANYLTGQPLYRWSIVSPDGGPVTASNGRSVDTGPVDCVGQPDIVFVVGGIDVQRSTTNQHLAALRRFARTGSVLDSLCTGTYALARAGLLAGYACAIHWENMSALKEEFPDTRFLKELFVIDRDRVTCTGGVALLNLIASRVGTARVTQIAEQFIVEHVRDTSAQQRMPLVARLGSANKSLFEVIFLMENNIEEPLSREELARLAGMSQRQLQRLFHEHLGTTPTHYYLTLRLRRARELLLQTDMSIMHITMACGFQSACHFSKSYRDAFGTAPTRERRKQVPSLSSVPSSVMVA
ncbi:Transcriptional regulator containing an amidase domain and an AraC-type DNA-binding HTH domain [Candidatus Burkholderia verschuerenii]|uniref:Transcriptional regulator containing an amidase domain and an AraC-type DNA-binding HTH domain n=1 Tax=Candidatus Burkholderia verschuerenii TaxID=242163 RepID=A0A0L0ME90_9BURK|nr:GlxA family transcriptional regulator [Candidatus Burkholderia verschuerenii]KND60601.1 Transcriptional regulator containing an amidase domain and an AraC-type DNA-binding HTH domain [Candidatus Burkholderia verschuerenii]